MGCTTYCLGNNNWACTSSCFGNNDYSCLEYCYGQNDLHCRSHCQNGPNVTEETVYGATATALPVPLRGVPVQILNATRALRAPPEPSLASLSRTTS